MTDQTDTDTARVAHLVPLPAGGQTRAASALCGALLNPEEVERVSPGHGMPCSQCSLTHIAARPLPPPDDAPAGALAGEERISAETDPVAAGAVYRLWGWPVSLRGDQIWLALDRDAVALVIPILMAAAVAAILSQRRCPPWCWPILMPPSSGLYSPGSRIRCLCPGLPGCTGSPVPCCCRPPPPPGPTHPGLTHWHYAGKSTCAAHYAPR